MVCPSPRCSGQLLCVSPDVHASDDVIAFEGPLPMVLSATTRKAGRKSKQPPLATKILSKEGNLPTEILLEDTDGCGSPLLLLTCSSDDVIAF